MGVLVRLAESTSHRSDNGWMDMERVWDGVVPLYLDTPVDEMSSVIRLSQYLFPTLLSKQLPRSVLDENVSKANKYLIQGGFISTVLFMISSQQILGWSCHRRPRRK